jgi:hypothetical protein
MKLSRFRRKSFTSMKKRKSTRKRRQTKRRPMKKFNIRKTHYMRGGGDGEMAILTEKDKTAIKNCSDISYYVKSNIDTGMGIEYIPEPESFKIHKKDGSMFVYKKENPLTYETLLNVYKSNSANFEKVPSPPTITYSSAANWDYERSH